MIVKCSYSIISYFHTHKHKKEHRKSQIELLLIIFFKQIFFDLITLVHQFIFFFLCNLNHCLILVAVLFTGTSQLVQHYRLCPSRQNHIGSVNNEILRYIYIQAVLLLYYKHKALTNVSMCAFLSNFTKNHLLECTFEHTNKLILCT